MKDPAVAAAGMWAVESILWIVDGYVAFLPDLSIRIINKVARRYVVLLLNRLTKAIIVASK